MRLVLCREGFVLTRQIAGAKENERNCTTESQLQNSYSLMLNFLSFVCDKKRITESRNISLWRKWIAARWQTVSLVLLEEISFFALANNKFLFKALLQVFRRHNSSQTTVFVKAFNN